jgi:hypothetical protein
MKTKNLIAALLFAAGSAFAQVPQGIPYQAIARNGQGQPLSNTNVKVRFSILDSTATGAAVYVESHSTTTSALGLFTANVGMGTVSTGTFNAINWGQNYKFLKVELDTTATGTSYIDLGTQQMMSVPYALYAGNLINVNDSSISNNINTSIFQSKSRKISQTQSISGSNISSNLLATLDFDTIQYITISGSSGTSSLSLSFKDSLNNPIDVFYSFENNGGYRDCGGCCGVYYHNTSFGDEQSSSINLGIGYGSNSCSTFTSFNYRIYSLNDSMKNKIRIYYSIGSVACAFTLKVIQ